MAQPGFEELLLPPPLMLSYTQHFGRGKGVHDDGDNGDASEIRVEREREKKKGRRTFGKKLSDTL